MGAKIDPLPALSDEELEVCWWAALAFGDADRSAFNPQPDPIEHLGAALRESIRRAMKAHPPSVMCQYCGRSRVCGNCGVPR